MFCDFGEWKPINGYNGRYLISDYGEVKSRSNGTETILKQEYNSSGYKRVTLYKNGKRTRHFIHRLVAEHFIPNPENLPLVNHIDEDKENNIVSNLEWCNGSYNQTYGTITYRKNVGRKQFYERYMPIIKEKS